METWLPSASRSSTVYACSTDSVTLDKSTTHTPLLTRSTSVLGPLISTVFALNTGSAWYRSEANSPLYSTDTGTVLLANSSTSK